MSCVPFQPSDIVICKVTSSRALITEGNFASAGQQGNMGLEESQNHRIIEYAELEGTHKDTESSS